MNRQGFTLVEMVVATGLMMIILLAGTTVFVSAQSMWSLSYTQIQLQDNLRQGLQRVSAELQESGRDSSGVLQVTINDNAGLGGTDILKFSIPICVCGTNAITSTGNVRTWGAPLTWGNTGCNGSYTVVAGKVDVCHAPPGNSGNTQSLNVNVSSVKAHLAHGDWLGTCNSCNPTTYTNRYIQYHINSNNQLLREVLDSNNAVIASVIMAENISNFQASFGAGSNSVTLSITLGKTAVPNRAVTVSGSAIVILRNGS